MTPHLNPELKLSVVKCSSSVAQAPTFRATRIPLCGFSDDHPRRPIGTFYLLAYFTTRISTNRPPFVRVGIWRFSPKPFWIWKHIHVHKVHVYEVYAHEVHAYELHAHEVHTHDVHAREVHAREIHAHDVHASEMIVSGLHRHRRYRRFLPTRVWLVRVGTLPASMGAKYRHMILVTSPRSRRLCSLTL
jgi:hypothetical protein